MNEKMNWYALYTKPFWEKKLCAQLVKSGFESYCPVQKVTRQWSDRKKVLEEPLFRSYVFVRTDSRMLAMARQITGIVGAVSFAGRPAVIKDEEIQSIRDLVDRYSNIRVERLDYNVNDNVRILSGPFRDINGCVKEIKKRTVRVLLPSFGHMLVAEFERSNLQLTSSDAVSN